jgi:hypothetical protein
MVAHRPKGVIPAFKGHAFGIDQRAVKIEQKGIKAHVTGPDQSQRRSC